MEIAYRILTAVADHAQLIATIATILLAFVESLRSRGNLRQGILALMLRAEKATQKGQLDGMTGDQLMDLVVQLAMERVVPQLPVYVRPFITEQAVRRVAAFTYAEAKLYLQSGHLVPMTEPPDSPAPPTVPVVAVAASVQTAPAPAPQVEP